MKGDTDTKHLVKEIYVYSDGSERVVEIRPNPNTEEIVNKMAEAKEELDVMQGEVTASEPVADVVTSEETLSSTADVEE